MRNFALHRTAMWKEVLCNDKFCIMPNGNVEGIINDSEKFHIIGGIPFALIV